MNIQAGTPIESADSRHVAIPAYMASYSARDASPEGSAQFRSAGLGSFQLWPCLMASRICGTGPTVAERSRPVISNHVRLAFLIRHDDYIGIEINLRNLQPDERICGRLFSS